MLTSATADAGAHADAAGRALRLPGPRCSSPIGPRYRITTTAILPGRACSEDDLGELVAFLVSPAGEYYSELPGSSSSKVGGSAQPSVRFRGGGGGGGGSYQTHRLLFVDTTTPAGSVFEDTERPSEARTRYARLLTPLIRGVVSLIRARADPRARGTTMDTDQLDREAARERARLGTEARAGRGRTIPAAA